MIPLDEPVVICAKNKKSVVEVEYWQKIDGDDEICITTLWRNGEFSITCRTLHEARYLENLFNTKEQDKTELGFFEDWEMLGTFDGISTDFDGDCELLIEAEENEPDFYYPQWLEENGWDHIDTQYYIYGAVQYVKD